MNNKKESTKDNDNISKRERFAMAAMQGMSSNPDCIGDSYDKIAKRALSQADALLNELEE